MFGKIRKAGVVMKRAWLVFEFLIACVGLLLVCLFCAYVWPESTYGLAAWVQALGSIGAILAAVYVVYLQGLKERQRSRDAEKNETRIALLCIYSEIRVHLGAVKISEKKISETRVQGKAQAFPEMFVTFPIYTSLASKLALVPSDDLRKKIITIYANFNSYFWMVNDSSRLALETDPTKKEDIDRHLHSIVTGITTMATVIENAVIEIDLLLMPYRQEPS